ncbi:ribonuclease HII [Pseudomonadota bacterium]
MYPHLLVEKKLWNQGLNQIIGIDEVGRGCFAGPITVAAVMFEPHHKPITEVKDSKLLSPKKRTLLSTQIRNQAKDFFISSSSVKHINTHGISSTLLKTMTKVIDNFSHLEYALIDGIQKPHSTSLDISCIKTIKQGDRTCYSIAAASIIAKVARDKYMQQLHHKFPIYDWFNNKGYGTKAHRLALQKHGASPHHRHLFIRKTLDLI